jgi:hypothetical protein
MTLSNSVKDELHDLVVNDQHKPFIELLRVITYNMGTEVLKLPMDDNKFTNLAMKKARYDGAIKLFKYAIRELNNFKKQ